MKSAKVMLGFLLVAVTAVALVGCKHAVTEKELDSSLGKYWETQGYSRAKQMDQKKLTAWNMFYNSYLSSIVTGSDVSKTAIDTEVKKFNEAQELASKQQAKFKKDNSYAVIKYSGDGLKASAYKNTDNTYNKKEIAKDFEIEIKGDIVW